ncbi:flagellar basal body rod protein FlgB [Legionella israelensis]|uniref:flagellar basal body rod protein FlgB n=1 Tax=Legionella israelensis TaxID=454 RepID=UPI00117E747B|nr:flagellar basal body rod protein FlgB [Legionella israelensis]QDP73446.1 flagellar basal body rod protein FlgB [Legionella israelensis]
MSGMLMFQLETKALKLCEKRSELVARNIANSNTPGYKAQDINFQEAMQKAKSAFSLDVRHPAHLSPSPLPSSERLYYRVPMQRKMDENTVDDEIERKNFMQNALQYQASVSFVQGKAQQYIKAFRGE